MKRPQLIKPGFTFTELLVVLVIVLAIVGLAIRACQQ